MPETNYTKNLVKKPIYEAAIRPFPVTGRQVPTMTYMSNDQVPGSNTYIEIGWVWEIPTPNPHMPEHTHNYDEVVLHLGTDRDKPEELGAEIEFALEGKKITIDKTSALFVPKGVKHGPMVYKKVDKPYIVMTVMMGAGTLAEARPGGVEVKVKPIPKKD
jgi:hypothetical protein